MASDRFITATMTIEYHDFDIEKFHKGLFDFGNRLIRRAGRAFCQELLNEVPVWSGMALASVKPLARAVRFALPISPVAGAPDRRALGESLGGKNPLSDSIISGTANMTFEFNWSTQVEHFNINEQFNVNNIVNPKTGKPYFKLKKPGPWMAIEKAMDAAEEVLMTEMVKAPKPTDYTTKYQVTFIPDAGGSFDNILNIGKG